MLLIRGPLRGWEPPGGQVEEGESIQDALVREVKEETGIDIELIKFFGIFQNLESNVCCTLWLAKPIGGRFTTSSESLEVGYFTVDEALKLVTWSNFRERIIKCLDEMQHPFFMAF